KDGTQDRTTGWVKYGARWYNPAIGRWTQQDTLDAPLDPANANRYAYAANDPINNADPLGLVTSQCLISGGVTAGLGLISVALAIGAVGATGTILGAPAGAVLTAGSLAVGGGPAASLTYSLFVCL
ncbi:RHS repeat-associated core domain-containing protein, partial [Paeniglutamicibacter cryotolerans]